MLSSPSDSTRGRQTSNRPVRWFTRHFSSGGLSGPAGGEDGSRGLPLRLGTSCGSFLSAVDIGLNLIALVPPPAEILSH